MSEAMYQVEGIVGYKQVRGVPYYMVHWAGATALAMIRADVMKDPA